MVMVRVKDDGEEGCCDEGVRHTRHTRREDDRGETGTFVERRFTNIGYGGGECEGGDTMTAFERRSANTCHSIGECEGGETTAAGERMVPNNL